MMKDKFYFKFSDLLDPTIYFEDLMADYATAVYNNPVMYQPSQELEGVFETFKVLASADGVYFAVSENENYKNSPEAKNRLGQLAVKFNSVGKKYEPILSAFETEKANLLKGAVTTSTSTGKVSPNTISTSTNSGTDTNENINYDTPQTVASGAIDNQYASNAIKSTTTHGLENIVSTTGFTDTTDTTTVTSDAAVIEKLNALLVASQNIINLWLSELKEFFIYNVD